jgi:hypothetical protein
MAHPLMQSDPMMRVRTAIRLNMYFLQRNEFINIVEAKDRKKVAIG